MPDPDSIAGLQAWFEADSIAAADDDPVTTWQDSHTTNQDAVGGSPLYKTNVQNGLPVVRFDATDDQLKVGTLQFTSGAFTIAVLYSYRSAASAARRAVRGGSNWLIGPYSNLHQAYAGGFLSPAGPAVVQDQFVIHTVTQNATTTTGYVNGTQYGTHSSPTYPGDVYLGSATEPLDGDMAAFVAYDSVLSSGDLATVWDFWTAKWLPAPPDSPSLFVVQSGSRLA